MTVSAQITNLTDENLEYTVSLYLNTQVSDTQTLDLAPSGVALGLFDPVSAATAQSVLALASVGFLALGIWVFSRKEYD